MGRIQFSDSLLIGIDEIDKQHMMYLDILNELLDSMKERKSREIQSEIIDKLISYAFYHFTKEERYLNESTYPGKEQHKREHEAFVEKLIQFKKDYDTKKLTLTIDIINFMNNWWINHIKVSDKKYQPYLVKENVAH